MTLFDTSAVIDLTAPGSAWHGWASDVYVDRRLAGDLKISHVVLAELYAGRLGAERHDALSRLGFAVDPLDDAIAARAGAAHGEYRRRGGERRAILADFLIGAHAAVRELPLVTRDPSRFTSYFPEIELIGPEDSDA